VKLFILYQDLTGSDIDGGFYPRKAEYLGNISAYVFKALFPIGKLSEGGGIYGYVGKAIERILHMKKPVTAIAIVPCPNMERIAVLAK
jgi:hypothetical protein